MDSRTTAAGGVLDASSRLTATVALTVRIAITRRVVGLALRLRSQHSAARVPALGAAMPSFNGSGRPGGMKVPACVCARVPRHRGLQD